MSLKLQHLRSLDRADVGRLSSLPMSKCLSPVLSTLLGEACRCVQLIGVSVTFFIEAIEAMSSKSAQAEVCQGQQVLVSCVLLTHPNLLRPKLALKLLSHDHSAQTDMVWTPRRCRAKEIDRSAYVADTLLPLEIKTLGIENQGVKDCLILL